MRVFLDKRETAILEIALTDAMINRPGIRMEAKTLLVKIIECTKLQKSGKGYGHDTNK